MKKINVLCALGIHNPDGDWLAVPLSRAKTELACFCKTCKAPVTHSQTLSLLRGDLQKLNKIRLRRRKDAFFAALPYFTTMLTVVESGTNRILRQYKAGDRIRRVDLEDYKSVEFLVSARWLGFAYQKKEAGGFLLELLWQYFEADSSRQYYRL